MYLVATKDGKRLAIEIEAGKSDTLYNIKKDLEAGFDKVICFAMSEKLKDSIYKSLDLIRIKRDFEIWIPDSLKQNNV